MKFIVLTAVGPDDHSSNPDEVLALIEQAKEA